MIPERWREVEALYESAMNREPSLREAFLAEVCRGDEELKREVGSLLALNSTPALVDEPVWKVAGELLDNDVIVTAGTELGPYRIEGVLGEGGMGQVYRAIDTRLDRQVAIKVSREEFGARFQREAKAIAALNHLNICTLYDVGPNYLVMELVEGPTLAERIGQGPIPPEEALGIARQIADALEAAHERGIVHRDLKPCNIKIKPDGVAKVLDFGLAQVRQAESGQPENPENSPTLVAATQAGLILGTAAYMSPEQARGQAVDKRADIWAFGVVFYEMLTGQRLFEGATVSDTLAAVLTKEPDLERVPARERRLLEVCLAKDSRRRLRDIGDLWGHWHDLPSVEKQRGHLLPWTIAAVSILIATVAVWAWSRKAGDVGSPQQPLALLDVSLGNDVVLGLPRGVTGGAVSGVAAAPEVILSPDGTRLAFVSRGRLFTRRLDQSKVSELAETEDAFAPSFSTDGRWIAFFAQQKLKKISVDGGSAVTLCDVRRLPRGGAWEEDGNIIAALDAVGVLSRVPRAGGAPVPITELDAALGERTHRWPQVLPGGKAVLFTAHSSPRTGFDGASIKVVDLRDGRSKTVQKGGMYGRYLPNGNLIFLHRGTLFGVPFDLERLEARGTPIPVLEQVAYNSRTGAAQIDFSRTGTILYRSGGETNDLLTVQWLDGAGKTEALLKDSREYVSLALSPDGKRLAMSLAEGPNLNIWVYDTMRETQSRLTPDGGNNTNPVWSPDGRHIVFSTVRGISWTRSDGVGKPQVLTDVQSAFLQIPFSFTRDGKRLAFVQISSGTSSRSEIWTVPLENDGSALSAGKAEPFLQSTFRSVRPNFAPDGKWIAYQSDETGRDEIYVRAFPDRGVRWPVSNRGGAHPVWSRDTKELFFVEGDKIMVATYRSNGESFVADKPRVWSEKSIVAYLAGFALAPDAKRVLALFPAESPANQPSPNQVVFLQNFFDEIRRRTRGQ